MLKPPRVGTAVNFHLNGDANPTAAIVLQAWHGKHGDEWTLSVAYWQGNTFKRTDAVRHKSSEWLKEHTHAIRIDGYWTHIETPELDRCEQRVSVLEQQMTDVLAELHRLRKGGPKKPERELASVET